ncbi:hypothetical protein W04_1120 [Pseudoalteromonas sp. SW0106-04]|nr:hypothetical protein W04_1120 [Pseudoalteromonas sp. SW0106-04]
MELSISGKPNPSSMSQDSAFLMILKICQRGLLFIEFKS